MEEVNMSNYGKLKNTILEMLSDGQCCTTSQIAEECQKRGINIDEERSLIYNATFQLSKKGLIKKVGRGLFKQKEAEDTKEEAIDEAISIINRKLDYCSNLNWMRCSDDELKRARSDMNRLLKLADDILQKFPKPSEERTSNKAEALQTSEGEQHEGSDKIEPVKKFL